MEECFEWLRSGDDQCRVAGGRDKPSVTAADDDVPIFLREDADMSGAGALDETTASRSSLFCLKDGATPFLCEYPSADAPASPGDHLSPGGGSLQQADASRRGGQSSYLIGQAHSTGSVDRERPVSSTMLYADQPSAAVLNFIGDSGRTWAALHRICILGKGSYGCATLYSTRKDVSIGASPMHAVVVKDINMQTMMNSAEEISALQSELHVLRTVVGHPNLVQYVDALFDARPSDFPMSFILMEYCAGGDLAAVIDGRRPHGSASGGRPLSSPTPTTLFISAEAPAEGSDPLAERYVASVFIQVAVALNSLHTEYGILHRDVKPHNIFFLEDGITVRLGDFGISTQLSRVGDRAKEACGSPYYMAPELFEERAHGAAADVWSLGVVFYQLIARQLPFASTSAAELRALVCRGRCIPLHELQTASTGRYSHQLKTLVGSLLVVDEAARPTLRRILRHRYVREHLKYVPASVLTAPNPLQSARVSSLGSSLPTLSPSSGAKGVYASLFGEDVVAQAVANAVHAGVSPIVGRVLSP